MPTNRQTYFVTLFFLFLLEYCTAQCLVCNDAITVALDGNGTATITPDLILEGTLANCEQNFEIQLLDGNTPIIGNTLTCDYLDHPLQAGVVNTLNGNSCWTTVTAQDNLPPTLTCPDRYVLCHHSTHPDTIGYPIFGDNCTDLHIADLSYVDKQIPLNCNTSVDNQQVTMHIERHWTVSDATGMSSTCTQNIYLKTILFSDINFPADRNGITAPNLNCMDNPLDWDLVGYPKAFGKILDNMDYCQLGIFYNDLAVSTCGGGQQIYRTWEIYNWCTGNSIEHIQIINLTDQIPPTLACPTETIQAMDSDACTATVILPQIQTADACSDVIVYPTWQFGWGFGPFEHVPWGTYEVTYTSIDACGNQSVCTSPLVVEDNTPPIAKCKNELHVSLQTNGTARIYAHHFDNGSFDNCQITFMGVSRDHYNFSEFIEFDCTDIHYEPIPVFLKVEDAQGYSNICEGAVYLMDNIHPDIYCPADITIQCFQDLTDLHQTGDATGTDNCLVDTLFYEDIDNIHPNCGIGTVFRQWKIRDHEGLEKTCTQVITVENHSSLDILFPSDTVINLCQGTIDPIVTGKPILLHDACRQIGLSHEDQVLDAIDSCPMILRTWTVVDWCVYDENANSPAGQYEHQQWIEMADTEAPVIQCLTTTITQDTSTDCSSVYVQIPPVNLLACDTTATIQNDSPYADTAGADASGHYPYGTHIIRYTATDICGNVGTCVFTLQLVNNCVPTTSKIEGYTTTETGWGVSDVHIHLTGDTVLQKNSSTLGDFAFAGILAERQYSLAPQKDNDDANGISTFDIVLIQQHILGIHALDSPYKIIAADVNNSGSVSTFDIVQIRQVVLSQIQAFPNSPSWRFVATDFEFENPENPFLSPFPEQMAIENLESDFLNANFIAIKIGDVNGDASPNAQHEQADTRNENLPLEWRSKNRHLEKNQVYEVPIYASNFEDILGFQCALHLKVDAVEIIDWQLGDLPYLDDQCLGLEQIEEGIFKISWYSSRGENLAPTSPLVTLRILAKKDGYLDSVFQLARTFQNESYSEQMQLHPIELSFEDPIPLATGILLHQNYPNPCTTHTRIDFELPTPQQVHLRVFDSKGNLLWQQQASYADGRHQVMLRRSDLKVAAGILWYRLETDSGATIAKKMILY